ncbi:hypothetical protein ASF81_01010 [Brevundimonas sp. Leaf168]|nr:hypothetical protein ASF81_01010 [Brevundimonas sp. Leaf168]
MSLRHSSRIASTALADRAITPIWRATFSATAASLTSVSQTLLAVSSIFAFIIRNRGSIHPAQDAAVSRAPPQPPSSSS